MKKLALIIISVIVLVAIAGAAFYYLTRNGVSDGEPVDETSPRTFAPFGTFEDNNDTPATTDAPTTPTTTARLLPTSNNSIRQLSVEPAAAVRFVVRNGEEFVRTLLRGNGNVVDTAATSTKNVRLTNTTIPRIQEAVWANDTAAVVRYLRDDKETVEAFLATFTAPTSTEPTELTGEFLPANIKDVAINRDGTALLYLTHTETGSVVTLRSLAGQERTVFTSPLREWLLEWGRDQTATLTTKPSAGISGSLFSLNTQTGATTRLASGVRGLTTLTNPDATRALLGGSAGALSLSVLDTRDGSVNPLTLRTLPEKCAWSVRESTTAYCAVPDFISTQQPFPDAWYQGTVTFRDSLWKIDTQTGTSERVVAADDIVGESLDMINLSLNENESRLVFINKQDSTPWLVYLSSDSSVGDADE